LQYLAWPGYFQPIVKHEHKTRIRDAFAELIGGPSGIDELDIDQDLHRISETLSAQLGQPVDWYRGAVANQWQRHRDDHSRRAWLVRPGRGGVGQAGQWVAQNRIALPASHLPRIPAHASRLEVSQAVEQGYPHLDYQARFQLTAELHTFLSRMSPQDVVATVADAKLHLGTLTDDLGYVEDGGQQLERSVRWHSVTLDLDTLPSPLSELIGEPGTVVDLTDGLDALLATMHPGRHSAESQVAEAPGAGTVPTLPAITEELADSLHMPRKELQEIVDTLQERQQIVFYGPPGTGKTYLAQELARFLAGADDPSRVQLVQFHPSYAYEDFFEGYRPTLTESGQPGFALQAGPLRRQAARATSDSGREHPSFLIIDEMNRADLARVFGEMYFLLEYRDRTVLPQYSPDTSFRLPRNLFIIGTMNTADRSIAMVDAAIRRRFAFMELHPDTPPVAGVLRRHLEARGVTTEPADLLEALNSEIDDSDRDLRIGPSYFMKDRATEPGGLEAIWRYDLLPLLEEHYYGRLSRAEVHERFGLATLRRKIGRA
ncbi:MAG: AAA family ATPase, partial [Dietzia sp.]